MPRTVENAKQARDEEQVLMKMLGEPGSQVGGEQRAVEQQEQKERAGATPVLRSEHRAGGQPARERARGGAAEQQGRCGEPFQKAGGGADGVDVPERRGLGNVQKGPVETVAVREQLCLQVNSFGGGQLAALPALAGVSERPDIPDELGRETGVRDGRQARLGDLKVGSEIRDALGERREVRPRGLQDSDELAVDQRADVAGHDGRRLERLQRHENNGGRCEAYGYRGGEYERLKGPEDDAIPPETLLAGGQRRCVDAGWQNKHV